MKGPYVIKNQRGASPSRGLWMPELVLYGIRRLAKEIIGSILDMEVDHSASEFSCVYEVISVSNMWDVMCGVRMFYLVLL